MELVVFSLLSLIAGLVCGFIFGCSHKGLLVGLIKGFFIGGLFAIDLHLFGGRTLCCWTLFGASVAGSIIATYTDDEHWLKRHFDFRRHLDL